MRTICESFICSLARVLMPHSTYRTRSIIDGKQEKAMNLIKCENGDARKALQSAIEEHL